MDDPAVRKAASLISRDPLRSLIPISAPGFSSAPDIFPTQPLVCAICHLQFSATLISLVRASYETHLSTAHDTPFTGISPFPHALLDLRVSRLDRSNPRLPCKVDHDEDTRSRQSALPPAGTLHIRPQSSLQLAIATSSVELQ